MADCSEQLKVLKTAINQQRNVSGQKSLTEKQLDKLIDTQTESIAIRAAEIGDITKAIDEAQPTAASAADIAGNIIKKSKLLNDVKQQQKEGVSAFKSIVSRIVDIETPFARVGEGTRLSIDRLKDVYQFKIQRPFMELLSEEGTTFTGKSNILKMIRDNEGDVLRGLFGDTSTAMGKIGAKIRNLIDEANKLNSNIQYNFTPKINSFKLQSYVKKYGEAKTRAFFNEHVENGGAVFDQFVEDSFIHLSKNKININNADSYEAIHKAFSDIDLLGSVNENFADMSRRLAIRDEWGSNPNKQLDDIINDKDIRLTNEEKSILRAYLANSTVGDFTPVRNTFIARLLRGGRAVASSAFLGLSGTLTVMDRFTSAYILKSTATPNVNYTKLAKPLLASKEEKAIADMYGIGLEDFISYQFESFGIGRGRFNPIGEGEGKFIYNSVMKINQFMMRAYGITAMTRGHQRMFVAKFSKGLGYALDNTKWDDLHKNYSQALSQYGFNKTDWEKLQAIKNDILIDGVIDPLAIPDEQLLKRTVAFVRGNAERAIIVPGLVDELAVSAFKLDPSSAGYEIAKTATQFQSFAISHMRKLYYGMAAANSGDRIRQAMLMSSFAGGSLMMGYLIYNMRNALIGTGEVLFSGGEVTFEDVWEDVISIPGRSEEETADSITRSMIYGAVGGVLLENALNLLEAEGILRESLGVRSYRRSPTEIIQGPFFSSTINTVKKFASNLINEDFSDATDELGDDLLKFIPGSRLPGIQYLMREGVQGPLKDLF